MAEYVDREEYCEKHCRCSNEYCSKESCPIWKAPAADVVPVDEYIKREAVKGLININFSGLLAAIDLIPAADVVPVVHGHWIEDGDCQICSECGEEHCWDEYRAAYCDSCGAKMDGGDNDAKSM